MIVTIVIIVGVIVFLVIAYNAIVSHGDGLGNLPQDSTRRSNDAGVYAPGQDQPGYTYTVGHIATLAERQASSREYRSRVAADRLLDDWQARLEQEINDAKRGK